MRICGGTESILARYLRNARQDSGLDVLRCMTLPGVLKELAVFLVVYNLVRRVMREAARR